jgi:hypothetical protein
MIVFLYRPSPQVPEPSEQAAEKCFDAAVQNVNMQSHQMASGSVDVTWIFTQSLFMALNTILWSLSYPTIRQLHPIDEVKVYVERALEAIKHTSTRWPGVLSALQLYQNLIQGCLRAYSSEDSYVVRSPSSARDRASMSPPAPSYSPASLASASRTVSHVSQGNEEHSTELQNLPHSSPSQNGMYAFFEDANDIQNQSHAFQTQRQTTSHLQEGYQPSLQQHSTMTTQVNGFNTQSGMQNMENLGVQSFDPQSFSNDFPSTIPGLPLWDPSMASDSTQPELQAYNDVEMDTRPWLGSFGEEYSRYMHQAWFPPQQQMQTLSEEQQLELMAALEHDQLPDVSNLVSDSATTYTGHIL